MDNPAVHNLDDVRLRAENGQLVLEVAGQTVPVDVDIDGSLSLDEIEAFTDNSIDAKGSDLENLGSVSTEQLLTNPSGARVSLDTSQDVADGTFTVVDYDSVLRDNGGFADLDANGITIPSADFNFAMAKVGSRWVNDTDINITEILINNSAEPQFGGFSRPLTAVRTVEPITTVWFPVSEDDTITTRLRHGTGSTRTLEADSRNFLEVWAV